MNRTERMYAIVEELRRAAPRGRSSTWLAERFGVSTRTIKRDMRALYEAGTALVADEGRGGGYSLDRSQVLPPLTFEPGEAMAVAIAIAAAPDLPFRSEARAALARLLGAMSPRMRARARDLAARVWVRPTVERAPTASVLDEAVMRGLVVRIEYEDEGGRRTERLVEPMAFARTRFHWHLLAWCRMRQGGRWFRLDRVVAARLTRERVAERDLEQTFGPPPEDAHPVALEA